MNERKTPKPGGAQEIRELYRKLRQRKPSKKLLEILKKKPEVAEGPKKKIAKGRQMSDAEA